MGDSSTLRKHEDKEWLTLASGAGRLEPPSLYVGRHSAPSGNR
jgi:hypothetical protein